MVRLELEVMKDIIKEQSELIEMLLARVDALEKKQSSVIHDTEFIKYVALPTTTPVIAPKPDWTYRPEFGPTCDACAQNSEEIGHDVVTRTITGNDTLTRQSEDIIRRIK